MINVAIISVSVIDRGTFMPSAQQITGENHVTGVDSRPCISRVAEDLVILRDFAGDQPGLETAVTFLGVLAAGLDEFMDEFLAQTRGMAHLPTSKVHRGIRCVVVAGSLDQWRDAIVHGTSVLGPVGQAFSMVYNQIVQLGLGNVFEGVSGRRAPDGTLRLEYQQ